MKKVMVALITPFTDDDKIDYIALKSIIARLMSEGVDGFIICGTTAETPTLSEKERFEVLDFVVKETRHKIELWYGCGRNCTKDTISLCQKVQSYDIDGVLLVAPYYNRPSKEGIYHHYIKIANAIDLPIMLYNIPSRTGVCMDEELIERLIQNNDKFIALKQASDDLKTVRNLKNKYPEFMIYSGNDDAIDEGIDAGMDGVISVMGHLNLLKIKQFLKYDRVDNKLRKVLYQEAQLMFKEASPGCVKYLLSKRGECKNNLRLPMCPITKACEETLDCYDKF